MRLEKPINTLIHEFVSELDSKKYVQENTRWILSRFVNWMVQCKINVSEIRRADIIHYKNTLITEGKTPQTINLYLSKVRRFFKWMSESGYYNDVAEGVRSPKDTRPFLKDYLNPEQIRKLLNSIPRHTLTGKRDYAMINLMVCYGLRRCEVHRLTVKDVELSDDDIVLYIQRKGRILKEPIKIESDVFEPIEQYLIHRNNYADNSPLFGNHSQYSTEHLTEDVISSILKNYLRQIYNSKKLTCHSLRHSAAINSLKSGESIYNVKTMLGHKSIETTQMYLRAIEAEQHFNNPTARRLVKLYKNEEKTANLSRLIT